MKFIIKYIRKCTGTQHTRMNHVTADESSSNLPQTEIPEANRQCCSNNEEDLIFMLNDDCFEIICRKLPIKDQINFALTCQRFFNVMAIISKKEHVYENTDNLIGWSLEMTKNFFRVVGEQIQTLDINYFSKSMLFNGFSSLCQNVKQLRVRGLDTNSMILLVDNMKSLQHLEVFDSIIDDNFFKHLNKFEHLKYLHIRNNYRITGKNIELLDGLDRLQLNGCHNLKSENFRNICTNLKNLHHLDILFCYFLKLGDCEHISQNLLQLESLKLSCSEDDIKLLAELRKLKKLEIDTHLAKADFFKNLTQLEELKLIAMGINDDVFSTVSELKNLKVLHIDCNQIYDEFLIMISKVTELEELKLASCNMVTDSSVLYILEKCLKLKRLDLARCDSLTPVLLEDMIRLLKKQSAEHLRKDRVVFTGTYSFCHRNFKKNLHLVDDFSDLIVISLKEDNDDIDNYTDTESEFEYDPVWEDPILELFTQTENH